MPAQGPLFTYDLTLTAAKDQVRLLVEDTDPREWLMADQEISFFLATWGGVQRTASAVAGAIAAKFARAISMSSSASGFSGQLNQKYEHYTALARYLRVQADRAGLNVYAGGIHIQDKQTTVLNSDRVMPKFRTDMMQEPGTEPVSTDPNQGYYFASFGPVY